MLAGLGGAIVLVACGTDSQTSTGAGITTSTVAPLGMQPRFDQNQYAVANRDERLVISLLTSQGDTPKDLPPVLDFTASANGRPIGGTIHAAIAGDGIPIPYYPVHLTTGSPGPYTLSTVVNGTPTSTNFTVSSVGHSAADR